MNENATRPREPFDDEILAGVHQHMSGVESLLPSPRGWITTSVSAGALGRTAVRSGIRFAGLAPLVMIALVLVVVLGAALGSQGWRGSGGGPGITLVYRLVAGPGQQVTDADLDATVAVLKERLSTYGSGAVTIGKLPPDRISISVTGVSDTDELLSRIGQTGKLEFVLLPAATYGTAANPGSVEIPTTGSRIDPSLPAQFTGSDIDLHSVAAATDPNHPGIWLVNFAFTQQAASEFATWTGQHVSEYFGIVLDGVVLSVPYIQSAIVGGSGQINGNYTQKEAQDLAQILRSSALPFPLALVSMATGGSGETGGAAGPVAAPSAHTPSDIPSNGRTLGGPSAPLTLDVWADYQCPLCKTFATDVQPRLIDAYVKAGKLKIVYHDFLVIDANAGGRESLDAANAARCAADQGKFWDFQDWLWANQGAEGGGSFTPERLVAMGLAVGLDATTFQSCVEGGTHDSDVAAESAAAQSSGIVATPALALNGKQLSTSDYETVAAAIDLALATLTPSPVLPSPARSESAAAAPSPSAPPPGASVIPSASS